MSNPCRIHLLSDVGRDRDFLKIFFGCGPFLKSLWNLIQHSFCFMFWCFGLEACGLSSPTRDWTYTPCSRRQSLNQWTTGKSLRLFFSPTCLANVSLFCFFTLYYTLVSFAVTCHCFLQVNFTSSLLLTFPLK